MADERTSAQDATNAAPDAAPASDDRAAPATAPESEQAGQSSTPASSATAESSSSSRSPAGGAKANKSTKAAKTSKATKTTRAKPAKTTKAAKAAKKSAPAKSGSAATAESSAVPGPAPATEPPPAARNTLSDSAPAAAVPQPTLPEPTAAEAAAAAPAEVREPDVPEQSATLERSAADPPRSGSAGTHQLGQPGGPAAPGAWAAALWEALQHADQPPQRLADLAVAELGPRAAAWAAWLRATYPDPPDYGIARLATAQASRLGVGLALAEVAGPTVAPLRLPAAAWVRATVILRIAAAYGHDPADPRRAADLIELLGLDPASTGDQPLAGLGSLSGAAGQLGLIRFGVSRLGLRKTPAASVLRVLFAASDNSDSLTRLAHRAARHFRTRQPA